MSQVSIIFQKEMDQLISGEVIEGENAVIKARLLQASSYGFARTALCHGKQ
jgi:hypothetical protein